MIDAEKGVSVQANVVGAAVNGEPFAVVADIGIACDIVVDVDVCVDFFGVDPNVALHTTSRRKTAGTFAGCPRVNIKSAGARRVYRYRWAQYARACACLGAWRA